jgi:putative ABC transport system substrate-binding protein
MRRIGVLMSTPDDSLGQAWLGALTQGLQQSGWEVGRNIQIDIRWGAGDTELFRKYAAELVALGPDVVVATANSIVSDFQQESRTIPIVFVLTIDPVGSGLVESLAHPGGNTTGFTAFEFSMNTKLLELLKEIAPDVKRVAVIRDPTVAAGAGGFAAIQTVAASSGVELTPVGVHDAEEIERGIADFVHGTGDGLIVVGPPSSVNTHRDLIVALAAQYHLPAVYSTLAFVGNGALASYGIEGIDQCRRAAGYVDRILKGEKPGDLPVQAPTRYELVINLKTATALGIGIPAMLLATADRVIE